MNQSIKIRSELVSFMKEMELALQEIDHEEMKTETLIELKNRMFHKLGQFVIEVELTKNYQVIMNESVNIANLAMMIFDNAKRLKELP